MSKKEVSFAIFTVALVCVIAFLAVRTVQGQEDPQRIAKEMWYIERETELLADTREYLSDAGFRNSGVTLSRTVGAEGNRSYTFTIHHRRIDCMDEAGRQALREELSVLTEPFVKMAQEDSCTFEYRYLTP